MVANTVAEERSSKLECRKSLFLYMSILKKNHSLVDTYPYTMNDIVLSNMGNRGSAAIPLTRIAIFQMLRSELFYNFQMRFFQWTKYCENM